MHSTEGHRQTASSLSQTSSPQNSVNFLAQVEGRRSPPVMRLWTVHSEGAGIATVPPCKNHHVMLVQPWCARLSRRGLREKA